VQSEVERALATVLRLTEVRVVCAGRTDAGVHARDQVVHVDVPETAYAAQGGHDTLARRLAGVLPDDIGVRAVRRAAPGFDARFSPLWRRYAYRISEDPFGPDPLLRHQVLAHRRPLDVEAMTAAAAGLMGTHDFAAFCRRREGATTVRTLLELGWVREDRLLVARVVADAFCHTMVRALVGASLAVGEGRRAVGWPASVLAGRERVPDLYVAPPHGLTLEEVRYPAEEELAARAVTTRARRGVPAR
jgi:tRNA pseudouridine38-40 synthase